MTKISNKIAYNVKNIVNPNDYIIGTDSETSNLATKNYLINDIAAFAIAGLSPEVGGTMKITEIEPVTAETDPVVVANALSPDYTVAPYELLFLNLNNVIHLLKLVNRDIGSGATALPSGSFISWTVSVGPAGPAGDDGAPGEQGPQGDPGQDYTANNLQRTVTDSFTVLETDNNHTIIINNGATAITVTVPTGLTEKFAVGFIQQGTGDVTFVESGTTINSPLDYLKIKGENFWAYLEKVGATEVFQLAGEIKG